MTEPGRRERARAVREVWLQAVKAAGGNPAPSHCFDSEHFAAGRAGWEAVATFATTEAQEVHVTDIPVAAALMTTLKEECERQHERAEKAEARVAAAEGERDEARAQLAAAQGALKGVSRHHHKVAHAEVSWEACQAGTCETARTICGDILRP